MFNSKKFVVIRLCENKKKNFFCTLRSRYNHDQASQHFAKCIELFVLIMPLFVNPTHIK